MLKLRYSDHLIRRVDSLEKTLMLGKIESRRRRGRHRMRWFDGRLGGHEFEHILGDVKNREAWHAAVQGVQRVGHNLVTEQE